jgi:large subunit ribosomal protein L13
MDMNKTFFLRREDEQPRWRQIDAQGKIVGRLATEIADALRGKDRATYTPHADAGDYVVVINAEKIVFTGNKMTEKIYQRYTGYIGNRKEFTPANLMEKSPERIIELAVRGMLPKNKLARELLRKLRVYKGSEHPHAAQIAGFPEDV